MIPFVFQHSLLCLKLSRVKPRAVCIHCSIIPDRWNTVRSRKMIPLHRSVRCTVARHKETFAKSWFESTRSVKFIRFKYLWDEVAGGRVGDSGSIWWRRENDFDSLFPRRKAMRPAAASFLGEKFSDRTDYERKDDHPGRQMVDLIGWTSVPRIGNLVERHAKQHRRRIGCIMRVDFTFRSFRDCLFFHFFPQHAQYLFVLRGLLMVNRLLAIMRWSNSKGDISRCSAVKSKYRVQKNRYFFLNFRRIINDTNWQSSVIKQTRSKASERIRKIKAKFPMIQIITINPKIMSK